MPRIALVNSPSAVQKNSTSMGGACLSPETDVLCGGARRAQRPTLALLSDHAAGRSPKRSAEAAGVVAADGASPKNAKVDRKKPQGKPEEGLAGDACMSDPILVVGALQSAMMGAMMDNLVAVAAQAAKIQAAENDMAAQVEAAPTLGEPTAPAAADAGGSATANTADAADAVADATVADATNATDNADAVPCTTTWSS